MDTRTRRALFGGAVIAIAALTAAQAQQPKLDWTPNPDAETYNDINCALLKGAPQVCILNKTGTQVTDIDCESKAFFGGTKSKGISLPRGGVAPHSVTIVNMASCKTTLVFTLPGGKERRIPNVDTDNMTIIEVPKQ
jgi:hypothetical protein